MGMTLDAGETSLGTWTIMYQPPGGGRYNGVLNVTDKRLLYDAKFDVSAKGIVEETLFYKTGSEAYVAIPRDRISKVEAKKSMMAKKVIVTLDDGSEHTFNYGMLGVDKIVEAIGVK